MKKIESIKEKKLDEETNETAICHRCGRIYAPEFEVYCCTVCGSETCSDCGGHCGCEENEKE